MASGDHQEANQSPKKSGKKDKKLSQKEQSERFIETARTLEADESGNKFERAIKRVLRASSEER